MAPDLIGRYDKLQKALKRLNAVRERGLSLESFKEDADLQAQVERHFQVAVEALLDIGNHLISKRALDKPESNAQVFTILGQSGLLPEDLAEKLARWARFRNILVHGYADLDPDLEHRALTRDLGELSQGASALARHLEDDFK